MFTYTVISDAQAAPDLTDLSEPYVQGPSSRGGVSYLTFPDDLGFDAVRYEPAVGVRCRVIRTDGERTQECGGAVSSVEPIRVTLDGAGWQAADSSPVEPLD